MKSTFIQFLLFVCLVSNTHAQDLGKVIIRNANPGNPGFIVSLNGVRISNDYNSTICFDYLEEKVYRIKMLQAGSTKILSFVVNSEPNYICRYLLNKENNGSYAWVLESKVLMTEQNQLPQHTPGQEHSYTQQPNIITNMSDADYNDVLKSVKKESFENTRLEIAKTFFGNQVLSSSQVSGILKVFSFENSKVDFAKFAYSRTIDKNNYFKVFDAFSFSDSKKELSEFIKNNPQ